MTKTTRAADRVRVTYATALVLHAVAAGLRYGFDIMDATGLPGGTVYPALRRLEAAGLLSSDWEDARVAQARRRPTRRFYAMTDPGRDVLHAAEARFPTLATLPAAPPRQIET